MNEKRIAGAAVGMVFKVCIVVIIIMFVYRCSLTAYEFGFAIFADKPVDANSEATVSVAIEEDDTSRTVGEKLEERGLIEDAFVFSIQEFLSEYKDSIKPGVYELSPSMNAETMLSIISRTGEEGEEDGDGDDTTVIGRSDESETDSEEETTETQDQEAEE